MTTLGILGAGQAGSALARAFVAAGHDVIIAGSADPESLAALVSSLGSRARAAWASEAAAAADVAVLAFPYRPEHELPAEALAGKIVLDNNNYMPWRDGHFQAVASGQQTVHELRQQQLPGAKLAKAFSHIQFHGRALVQMPSDSLPALQRLARPPGASDRTALVVSSDFPEAVELVGGLYDDLGFDTVDNSPLRESWRSAPGTPAWEQSVEGQSWQELTRNLQRAHHPGS